MIDGWKNARSAAALASRARADRKAETEATVGSFDGLVGRVTTEQQTGGRTGGGENKKTSTSGRRGNTLGEAKQRRERASKDPLLLFRFERVSGAGTTKGEQLGTTASKLTRCCDVEVIMSFATAGLPKTIERQVQEIHDLENQAGE